LVGKAHNVLVKTPAHGTPGARLRAARKAEGKTLEELAEHAGYSRGHVNNMELNKDLGGREAWKAVAEALGLSIDYLLKGSLLLDQSAESVGESIDDPQEMELLVYFRMLPQQSKDLILAVIRGTGGGAGKTKAA
jgi:transcriptional regulator with XRE-family HTH domain